MLNDLLRIKKIREKAADDEVRKCRYRVELAQQDLEKSKKELTNYQQWRVQEENRLYEEIINAQVKQFDLDMLKQKVAQLRERDLLLQDAITKAEEHLEETKKQLDLAQENYRLASQAGKKFEEFIDVMREDELKEKARIEELELEEFTTPRNRD